MKINGLKLGIIGGGQFGKMLIQEAVNWDIHTVVLDGDASCPCRHLCSEFIHGDIQNFDHVMKLGSMVDVITIEIEHVNVEALVALQNQGKNVFPQPDVIKTIQDKGLQKLFYEKHAIATSPFFLTESKNGLLARSPKFPFVQKLRKNGYDGRGVVVVRSETDLKNAFDAPSVVEHMADIDKEISILVSRNQSGATSVFPPVELVFDAEANLVDFLFAPAAISAEQTKKASAMALKIIEELNMVGLLAVEMFVCKDGSLLVNEIAPRPHNSGHHTIEANITSQYEQHLRAILSLPPGDTKTVSPAAMVNLLGEKGSEGAATYEGLNTILSISGVYLHLYGKSQSRPFRKMGHVTVLASTAEEALEKAKSVKKNFKVRGK